MAELHLSARGLHSLSTVQELAGGNMKKVVYTFSGLLFCTLLTFVCYVSRTARAAGTTYYSQGNLAPNLTSSWNTIRGGGGFAPANFTSGDIFVVQGTGNGGTTPHAMTTSAGWSISGAGSKLQIENGATLTANNAITLASATTFQLDAGGTYVHNNTTAYGTSILQGTESFAPTTKFIRNK